MYRLSPEPLFPHVQGRFLLGKPFAGGKYIMSFWWFYARKVMCEHVVPHDWNFHPSRNKTLTLTRWDEISCESSQTCLHFCRANISFKVRLATPKLTRERNVWNGFADDKLVNFQAFLNVESWLIDKRVSNIRAASESNMNTNIRYLLEMNNSANLLKKQSQENPWIVLEVPHI